MCSIPLAKPVFLLGYDAKIRLWENRQKRSSGNVKKSGNAIDKSKDLKKPILGHLSIYLELDFFLSRRNLKKAPPTRMGVIPASKNQLIENPS